MIQEEEEDGLQLVNVHGVQTKLVDLRKALNSCLPPDLQINEIIIVPSDFDVVRDCRWKRYRYTLPLIGDADYQPLLKVVASHASRAARRRVAAKEDLGDGKMIQIEDEKQRKRPRKKVICPPLSNLGAMRQAASLLEGRHDFGGFQASGGKKDTVRTLFRCEVVETPRASANVGEVGQSGLEFIFEGDGFLYKQVCILSGEKQN